MKNLICTIFFSLLTLVTNVYAQDITGNISDAESGLPLMGVNIAVEGLNKGAVTDFDGNFNISNVDSGTTLIFTYIGYKTFNQTVDEETNLMILM